MVDGPVTGVVGGLALITFGRALILDRVHEVRLALALGLLAGALGVAVLRWSTLDLAALRGAQAVLGPTLLVGPAETAAACIAAAVGGAIALGAWLEESAPEGAPLRALPLPEALVGSASLAAAFWGPAPRGMNLGDLMVAVAAIALFAGVGVGVAIGLRRMGPRSVWAAVIVGATAVGVAAGLLV